LPDQSRWENDKRRGFPHAKLLQKPLQKVADIREDNVLNEVSIEAKHLDPVMQRKAAHETTVDYRWLTEKTKTPEYKKQATLRWSIQCWQ
jgi:hypothetical protein